MNRFGVWTDGPYPVGPEALAESPRRTTSTILTRLSRLGLFAILLIAPGVILGLGWDAGKDYQDLAARGRPVQGRVTQKYTRPLGRNDTSYHVQYVFEVEGRFYNGVDAIGEAEFDSYNQGSPCAATYLPARPATNCLGRPADRASFANLCPLVLAGLVALVMAGLIVWWESGPRRERFLARWGVAVAGRVTARGTGVSSHIPVYWIRYFYHAGSAVGLETTAYVPKKVWDRIADVETVTVLYDPEAPEKSLPVCALRYVALSLETSAAAGANLSAEPSGPASTGVKPA